MSSWSMIRLFFVVTLGFLLSGGSALRAQELDGVIRSAVEDPCEPLCGGVSVTPDGEQLGTHRSHTGGHTVAFTVRNTGSERDLYVVSCDAEAPVTCGGMSERVVRLEPDASAQVEVTYSVGATGTGTLRLVATSEGTLAQDEGYYRVPVSRPSVEVTPDAEVVHVLGGRTSTQTFRVRNVAGITVGVDLSVSCVFPAVACAPSSSRLVLPRDAVQTVDVRFYYVTGSMNGRMTLTAATDHNALSETGWVELRGGSAEAPIVDVAGVNPGEMVARDLCLTASAGAGAAYECGDLRIAHPLPATRTLNKERAPVLTYNSGQAHPYPVVAAQVTQGERAARPDRVVATLKVQGVERAGRVWDGSEWSAGSSRRIALAFDALSDETGVYEYTLEVENVYGYRSESRAVTGRLAIVNRSESPFGAGWWLAGLERLYPGPRSQSLLWVGGDGSVRVYDRVQRGVWAAPGIDRPDTLKLDGIAEEVVRYLPHGVEVRFDWWTGQHVSTVNRLGHVTHFDYDAEGRLSRIRIPPAGSDMAYRFGYDPSDRYWTVRAGPDARQEMTVRAGPEPPEPPGREVVANLSDGRVVRLHDPDNTKVSFVYDPGFAYRVASIMDRRGTTTSYEYDAAAKLRRVSVDMGPGKADLVTHFRAGESVGAAGSAVHPDEAYTRIDGPRTDVQDVTRFWLDRLGQPVKIRDALGHETGLTYGDERWPGLVTRVRHPNGRVVSAAYDDRGNILARTDSSTYRDASGTISVDAGAESVQGVGATSPMYELFAYPGGAGANPKAAHTAAGKRTYATTRYEWDRRWDFVTKIVRPERDSTVMAYDPENGNRLWQQDGRGPVSRVAFAYNALGLLETIDPPASAPQRVEYDGLGNVHRVITGKGFRTTYHRDAFGRDTLIVSPIDSMQTAWRSERIEYDAADRVIARSTTAPGAGATQTLHVTNSYDAEGNLTSVSRRSGPDPNGIGQITRRWRYDAAGRRVAEIAPDGAVDSTVYDPAGNPVAEHTRRDHVIAREYDALDRLVRRTVPGVTYDRRTFEDWEFPLHSNCPGDGLCIPADVATFTYDAMGNMLSAENGDARIRRTYHANGNLLADSTWIRTYAPIDRGGSFNRHVYGLEYGYDLNGRRTWMKYPHQLAARFDGRTTVYDSAAYHYEPATGRLSRVVDVLGAAFDYEYDGEGRLETLRYPRGDFRRFSYDDDSRIVGIRQDRTSHANGYEQMSLRHDARDKVLDVSVDGSNCAVPVVENTYAGLGMVVWSHRNVACDRREDWQLWRVDALSNIEHHQDHYTLRKRVNGRERLTFAVDSTRYTYQPGTGRQIFYTGISTTESPSEGWDPEKGCEIFPPRSWISSYRVNEYDAAGNITWTEKSVHTHTGYWVDCNWLWIDDGQEHFVTASYYGADGKLRAVDKRSGDPEQEGPSFEEYRYDALGRRVLRRSRNDEDCPSPDDTGIECFDQVLQRFVWDGDQIIAETQYPGADMVSPSDLERETEVIEDDSRFWGRVLYTHGAELDRPLDVIRIGYGNLTGGEYYGTGDVYEGWEPLAIAPQWDWRGEGYGHAFYGPTSPTKPGGNYVFVRWPVYTAYGSLMPRRTYETVGDRMDGWFGSLLRKQQDGSGLQYKRNRYYDPGTGRFTQEDPIGLAGGLNLYGFADGDPINVSDPFGLCPGCPGDGGGNGHLTIPLTSTEVDNTRTQLGAVRVPVRYGYRRSLRVTHRGTQNVYYEGEFLYGFYRQLMLNPPLGLRLGGPIIRRNGAALTRQTDGPNFGMRWHNVRQSYMKALSDPYYYDSNLPAVYNLTNPVFNRIMRVLKPATKFGSASQGLPPPPRQTGR